MCCGLKPSIFGNGVIEDWQFPIACHHPLDIEKPDTSFLTPKHPREGATAVFGDNPGKFKKHLVHELFLDCVLNIFIRERPGIAWKTRDERSFEVFAEGQSEGAVACRVSEQCDGKLHWAGATISPFETRGRAIGEIKTWIERDAVDGDPCLVRRP